MEEGKSNFIWFGSSYKGVYCITVHIGNPLRLAVWVSIFDNRLLKGKLYIRKMFAAQIRELFKAKGHCSTAFAAQFKCP
jgi:hypothetical protein